MLGPKFAKIQCPKFIYFLIKIQYYFTEGLKIVCHSPTPTPTSLHPQCLIWHCIVVDVENMI